jgi:hypothetical protein
LATAFVKSTSITFAASAADGFFTLRVIRMRTFWIDAISQSWICCRHNRRQRLRLKP